MQPLIKVPLDLTLSPRGIIDQSNHSLNLTISTHILSQITPYHPNPAFLKFKNVRLSKLEVTLKDFTLTDINQQGECIPLYTSTSTNPPDIDIHTESNLFSSRISLILNPATSQLTMNSNRDIIKYNVEVIEQIKMANNAKLQSILEKFGKENELEYGFLTMDNRKRVVVSELETPHPKVGMWVYGVELGVESMYVYDLVYKFTTEGIENKCCIVSERKGERGGDRESFILQIYRGKKPQTYLLTVKEVTPETRVETVCYMEKEEVELGRGSERAGGMEFTLRENTIMNTIQLYSPIKNLKDNQQPKSYLQASPQFTKIDQSQSNLAPPTDQHLISRIKTQQDQIQLLKLQIERMKTQITKSKSSARTPQKIRFIRSPGSDSISSIKRTLRLQQLKESDLKVLSLSPSYPNLTLLSHCHNSNNSKESTTAKYSIEAQQFQKVREFILEEESLEQPERIMSARAYIGEIWDHIEIIQEQP